MVHPDPEHEDDAVEQGPESGLAGDEAVADGYDEPLPDASGDWVSQERPDIPKSFKELRLSPEIAKAIQEMGFEKPTPVQGLVYQPILDGYDLMVQSHTGSGKTVAFGLPLAELLNPDLKALQALILVPTRELAAQVHQELERLFKYNGITVTSIYGGAAIGPQLDALKAGVHVVAGTPGRVLDHIRRGSMDSSRLRALIFDEADEMMSMGFAKEVDAIVESLPKERQGQLFSATIPDAIRDLGRRALREPDLISLSDDFVSAEQIEHVYYLVDGFNKPKQLVHIIEAEQPESALVFCNTREQTAFIAAYLRRKGYDAEAISGDYSQSERERVMKMLKDKKLRFLAATDVAARGIDVRLLSHVINYELPESPEVYIHRTGRTGRAGLTGVAISVVDPRTIGDLVMIQKIYKLKMEERQMPDPSDIRQQRIQARLATLRNAMEGAAAPTPDEQDVARAIAQAADSVSLIVAMGRELEAAKQAASERPVRESRRSEGERSSRPRSDDRDEGRGRGRGRDRERGRGGDRDRDRGADRDRGGDSGRGGARARGRGADPAREEAPRRRQRGSSLEAEYRSHSSDEDESTKRLAARAARGAYDEARGGDPRPAGGGGARAGGDAASATEEGGPKRRRRRRKRRGNGGGGEEGGSSSSGGGGGGDGEEVWSAVSAGDAGYDDDDSANPPSDGERDHGDLADSELDDEQRRMSTIAINLGRSDDVRASEVARMVRDLSGLGRRDLGRVQVRDAVTHLSVRVDAADALLEALSGKDYKGKALTVERVR